MVWAIGMEKYNIFTHHLLFSINVNDDSINDIDKHYGGKTTDVIYNNSTWHRTYVAKFAEVLTKMPSVSLNYSKFYWILTV